MAAVKHLKRKWLVNAVILYYVYSIHNTVNSDSIWWNIYSIPANGYPRNLQSGPLSCPMLSVFLGVLHIHMTAPKYHHICSHDKLFVCDLHSCWTPVYIGLMHLSHCSLWCTLLHFRSHLKKPSVIKRFWDKQAEWALPGAPLCHVSHFTPQ